MRRKKRNPLMLGQRERGSGGADLRECDLPDQLYHGKGGA